jgi:2-dehydro-3-deoxyphosphogalactonate aldolase
MTVTMKLLDLVRPVPLIAILRGLEPAQAQPVGHALVAAGFRAIEVPLNRPGALVCIETLVRNLPGEILVGGGTMLTVADVDAVHAAGGRLMVSPNCNPEVIAHAAALGMLCAPGVATPTEAFAALQAGAHALKLFPSEMVGHGGLKALRSVLPSGLDFWPVGGVTPQSIPAWVAAGATGFGIGTPLFDPKRSLEELSDRAQAFVNAWNEATLARPVA